MDVIDDFLCGAVVLPFTGKAFRPVFLWMNQRKAQHRDEFQLYVVAEVFQLIPVEHTRW